MTALPDDVRELLAAVRDALNIPMPGIDDADERAHYRVLRERAATARIALDGVLDRGHGLADCASWVSRCIAEMPVTYTVWVPEQAAGTDVLVLDGDPDAPVPYLPADGE